jgi:hypothetical protein
MTFDQWVETVDGQKCVDDSILKRPEIDQAFLRNRLWWAFTAGMEKGRTDARAAQETKVGCATCNDTGSVQDSEVPYLGNPCPDCK